jgi:hypothetical protein
MASGGAGILFVVDSIPLSDDEIAHALGLGLIDAYIDGGAERLDAALAVLDSRRPRRITGRAAPSVIRGLALPAIEVPA